MDDSELQQALRYLGPLGYLADPEEPDPVVERFGFSLTAVPIRGALTEEQIVEALKYFQSQNGLYPSGELDEPTIALMNTPRCGVPDVGEYVLYHRKWPIKDLTYAIQEGARELLVHEMRQALAESFAAWSAVTPLTFREVSLGDNPHILIRFVSGDHGDGNAFDGPSGVLAHAYFPTHGGMHFDEAEVWTLGTNGIHLVTVAIHEIGHLLGLNHSQERKAIMYAYYGGPAPFLHVDDVAGIQALYGVKPPPTPEPEPAPEPEPGPFPPVDPPASLAWIP